MMLGTIGGGALHKEWQAELTTCLIASGNKNFANVESCQVSMKPMHMEDEEEAEFVSTLNEEPITKVIVEARCSGVNMNDLTVSEGSFTANVIEDAYNSLHGSSRTDDSQLSGLRYFGSRGLQNVGQGGGGWGGEYSSKLFQSCLFSVSSPILSHLSFRFCRKLRMRLVH